MIQNFKSLFFVFGMMLLAYSSQSQTDSKREVTNTYFLKNVLLVAKPGSPASMTNILIKNGVISEISNLAKPPFDAKVIAMDSMYVYAGFIDPMSHVGIKKEEEKKDVQKPQNRGAATLEQSGITPQVNAFSKFSVKEASIGDLRKAGFTVSQIFPKGRMLAGTSSIISLKESTLEDQALLKNNNGLMASFATASGFVPSTVIAVISKYRDVLTNTQNAMKNEAAYLMNPVGLKRPMLSKEMTALMPIMKKEMPFYFVANNSKDIFRAISLQKEFGYKAVLSEVKHCHNAIDAIKARGMPVLLSLDIPD